MKLILLLLSTMLIVSCNSRQSETSVQMGNREIGEDALYYSEDVEIEPPRTSSPAVPDEIALDKGSKVIKSGSLAFEVTKLEATKVRIDTIIQGTQSYYENEQYSSYGNRNTYSLTIRVPNANFESLIRLLEAGVGDLTSKSISANDVTEEYVDLNIRLENNLAYLKQYQTILLKATSIKEILEVKEKIRAIEEEIESKKGRLKYLENRVSLSTLHVQISELVVGSISDKPNFASRITNAFNSGAQGFLTFVVGLISFWPFLLMLALLIIGRKQVWNLLRKRRS